MRVCCLSCSCRFTLHFMLMIAMWLLCVLHVIHLCVCVYFCLSYFIILLVDQVDSEYGNLSVMVSVAIVVVVGVLSVSFHLITPTAITDWVYNVLFVVSDNSIQLG